MPAARLARSAAAALLLYVLLALIGCRTVPQEIRDIRALPQDTTRYLDPRTANRSLLSPSRQAELNDRYNTLYFRPWHRPGTAGSAEKVRWEFDKYRKHPGYGENLRKRSPGWIDRLAANADLANYPNAGFNAITVAHGNLRVLPTDRPLFSSIDTAGEGFPFDQMQNSAIYPNTPVYVSHVAKDKSWVYCESHTGPGWLPARDIAQIDEAFAAEWERHSQVAVIKDDLPFYDERGRFLFKARIGSQFPLLEEAPAAFRVLAAAAGPDGAALFRQALVSKADACTKPLPLTQFNIARLANEFMHEPYGWGGLFRDRDCSATTKDLFAPFGLWLPRHSSDQAMQGGTFIRFEQLSAEEKQRLIIEQGLPYLTLLWAPGHIMLYIGSHDSQPLIFHNLWGVKTTGMWGREGRHIVGHAAVTTLHPGAELPDADRSRDLLTGIKGMTLLGGCPRAHDAVIPAVF